MPNVRRRIDANDAAMVDREALCGWAVCEGFDPKSVLSVSLHGGTAVFEVVLRDERGAVVINNNDVQRRYVEVARAWPLPRCALTRT